MSAAANSFMRMNSKDSSSSSSREKKLKAARAESPKNMTVNVVVDDPSSANAATSVRTPWYAAVWQFLLSNPKLKKALGHISLVILLAAYTAAGASVINLLVPLFSFLPFEHTNVPLLNNGQ